MTFRLPSRRFGARWALEISTAEPDLPPGAFEVAPRGELLAVDHSVTLLKQVGR